MSFKPVQFSYGQVLVRGGRSAKANFMQTRKIVVEGRDVVFAHFSQYLPWVMKCVTGQINASRACMGRCKLPMDILRRVQAACDSGIVAPSDEQDPMNDIDDGAAKKEVKAGKKKERKANMCKGMCIKLEFPTKCLEAHPDCETTQTITVFVESRQKIWLSIEDVPWAIEYMHEQHKLKGVIAVDPEDVGPGGEEPVPQTPWATGHLPGEDVPAAGESVGEGAAGEDVPCN